MRITEYVGKEGVVSSVWDHGRMERPKPGDLIRWSDDSIGRVWEVGTGYCNPDEVHVCHSRGSAFLGWIEDQPHDPRHYPYEYLKGKRGHIYVSISGGPFSVLKLTALKPTFDLGLSDMWNWGDNLAGADMGVNYGLHRPIFAVDRLPGS